MKSDFHSLNLNGHVFRLRKLRFILIVGLVYSLFPLPAEKISDESVHELFILSSLQKMISFMPDQYIERTSLLVDAVPFENKEKLSQYLEANIRKAVDLEELNSFVKKELKKELTETEAQELLKWYSSVSGKRVMSFLSEYRSLRKTNEKLEDLAEDWVETDLGKTLKNNFEVVAYPAEILEWSQALDYITRVWIIKFIQPEAKLERREFARNISESYKEMTADDIEAMILAPWYILLSEMEPQDVDEYIKFSNTKAAIKFNQAIYRGVLNFFAAPYREQLLKIKADELKEGSP